MSSCNTAFRLLWHLQHPSECVCYTVLSTALHGFIEEGQEGGDESYGLTSCMSWAVTLV